MRRVTAPVRLLELRVAGHDGPDQHGARLARPRDDGRAHNDGQAEQRGRGRPAEDGAAAAEPGADHVTVADRVADPVVRDAEPVGHAHPDNIGRLSRHIGNAVRRRHVTVADHVADAHADHRVADPDPDADRYQQRQPDRVP